MQDHNPEDVDYFPLMGKEILMTNVALAMRVRGFTNPADRDKLNQSDLARKAKIDQKSVSNLLNTNQTSSPKLETIERIAHALGLEPWHLICPGLTEEVIRQRMLPSDVPPEAWAMLSRYLKAKESEKAEILNYAIYVFNRAGDASLRDFLESLTKTHE